MRRDLARADRPQVVHLSCHGGQRGSPAAAPEPVAFLENADGHRAAVGAGELLAWTRPTPGASEVQLVVLSACSTTGAPLSGPGGGVALVDGAGAGLLGEATARPAAAAGAASLPGGPSGFAERLVRGGLARVLAMQSTVSDAGSTAFAQGHYRTLGEGADLVAVLRAGRGELASAAGGRAHEWAVPALLTSRGIGPLAAPAGPGGVAAVAARGATRIERAREAFAIDGVTYLEQGYVGRRDAERRLRRAVARGDRLIVIHGLGGIG